MPWYAWTVIALCVVNAAANIAAIGKPRKPTTPGTAIAVCVVNGLIVWAIVVMAS